jgi:hypothetical protein
VAALAELRPGFHQLPPLLKSLTSHIRTLDLVPDQVSHGGLARLIWEMRVIGGPSFEAAAQAVRRKLWPNAIHGLGQEAVTDRVAGVAARENKLAQPWQLLQNFL